MKITLEQAVELLLRGEVVAIPTETVYGLAAVYHDRAAVQKIYQLKNRPPKNPLIMHLASVQELSTFTSLDEELYAPLAKAFWPGPLTLVLPAITATIPEIVRASLPTQAFRIPSHPMTLKLLSKTGPLVAPSANLSGRPSSVSEKHVETDFGLDFPVFPGGQCKKGVESTILAFQNDRWVIGRLGAIPPSSFTPILGYEPTQEKAVICPGQLYRHYAPQCKLILTDNFSDATCIIGFSDRTYPKTAKHILWGSSNHSEEVLSNLYDTLRRLDHEGISQAHVDMRFPSTGLWQTLLERLQKAAQLV